MESDNTGSLDVPELMLSQVFRLLKSFPEGTAISQKNPGHIVSFFKSKIIY